MKKLLALLLVLTMMLTMLAACGSSSSSSDTDTAEETTETTEEEAEEEETEEAAEETAEAEETEETEEAAEEDKGEFTPASATLPISEDGATLTMFVELPGYMSGFNVNSYDDVEAFQYAEEITGVDIEFTIVNSETIDTQFTLMVASGNLTDLIAGGSSMYTSAEQQIEDGAAIDLLQYEDLLPNYFAALEYYDDYQAVAISDSGVMPEVVGISDDYSVSAGMQIRSDWLEKLGMDVPSTYDEIYEVLTAFKVEFGADHALLLTGSAQLSGSGLVGGMGSIGYETDSDNNMFVVDGVIQNGFLADGYKDYLEMIAQWYAEGLIASDFATAGSDPLTSDSDALIQGGNAGIWTSQSDNLDSNVLQGQSLDADYAIVAMAQPTLDGDLFHFGDDPVSSNAMGKSVAISEACEDIELACAWLDFWFTEEGITLANYGLEGVSFEYDDNGDPVYTDAVMNNPDFPMISFAQTYYTVACVATVGDYDRAFAAYSDANLAAMELWTETSDNLYTIPSTLELTIDESTEYSSLWSDISTYASTEVFKFAMGQYNFEDDWDNFIETLESMGIDRCIEIYQDAYDRYAAAHT